MKYLDYLRIPYCHKTSDCLSLVRTFYANELKILIPEIDYEFNWHDSEPDLILRRAPEFGFCEISGSPKFADVLLLTHKGLPTHLGVVVDKGDFLHTTLKGTACHSYVTGFWADKICAVLRYKGLNDENNSSPRTDQAHGSPERD